MRNFAGKSNPEKKVWGVLGKQETFYSPEQFQDKGRIIPLNANPLEAWDATRSRYIRRPQMPPMPNDGQQAGVVPQGTPSPDVTPSPTPTPSITPSQTSSPTPTTTTTLTTTPTQTPTTTPTPTPNALCDLFIEVTGATNSLFNGTYFFDSISYINNLNQIISGANPDGESNILYKQSSNNLYLGRYYVSPVNKPWVDLSGTSITLVQSISIFDGTYYYPRSGPGNTNYYLTYPPVCTATQTPTNTSTPTPTLTPTTTTTLTATPTQTETGTPTPTPTNTNTQTPTTTTTLTATPTQTSSSTPTPTNTNTQTPTNTGTPTPTPSATPVPVIPSSNLQHWYISTSGASVSSWTNYGLLGTGLTNADVATQPQLVTSSLGSYSGQAFEFLNQDDLFGTFSATTYSGLTTFMVAKWLNNNTSGVYGGAFTQTNELFGGNNRYLTTYVGTASLSAGNSNSVAGQPLIYSVSGTPGVFSASYDIKSNVFTTSLNSSGATPAATTYLQIESITTSSPVVNLTMFEYIVYNRELSAGEYAQVINYLKTKYNYASW